MVNKLVREQPDAHVAVIFDAPGKTFRDEMFAEYKAHRPPMPDELRDQVAPILDAIRAMGLPLLQIEGVEADDVIGTLCQRAAADGLNVLVSTGDKDLAQLVNDNVTLINTMNDSLLDRAGVKEKFDVFPEQIIDYLALVGDTSDNIPGVPKVGAKTAAKWLNEYGSVEEIITHADDIKGKVGDSLRDNIEQLQLSQALTSVRLDVDLPISIDDLTASAADVEILRELFSRYELRTLLRQLDERAAAPAKASEAASEEASDRNYETVLSWQAFDTWLQKINAADLVAEFPFPSLRARLPTFLLRTTIRVRRINCRAIKCLKNLENFWRARTRKKSGITLSTTPMCLLDMASSCGAWRLIRCSSLMCSIVSRHVMIWTLSRDTTSVEKRFTMKM
jgi:DNA polymerase-1